MEDLQPVHDASPLWSVLAQAVDALERSPEEAGRQAEAALKIAPGQQQALQLIVSARRAQGDVAGARTLLESMVAESPDLAAAHYELGLLLTEIGDSQAAIQSLSRVVELEPKHPQAWRVLGDVLIQVSDTKRAANAYARQFESSIMDLKILEQVTALNLDQVDIAEDVLREFLNIYSTDLAALQMLGKMHMRVNQFESAEKVFERALNLASSFQTARLDYVSALHQQLKPEEENRQLDILLQDEPDNPDYRYLKATALSAAGKIPEAVQYCEDLVSAEPERHKFWLAYAHALRVSGRQEDCVAAYRKAIELEPRLGEGWWGLANLKTFRFRSSDVQTMRSELARDDLTDENRIFLHFALGKALEDVRTYEESFAQYSQGNALVRATNPYNIDEVAESVAREKRRFTREFFATHNKPGCP